MTMTLEELRAELSLVANNGCVTCSRENISEWRDASDAAIKERDELRDENAKLLAMLDADSFRLGVAESELTALKQRISEGRYAS